MKSILLLLLLVSSTLAFAQTDHPDFDKLVQLGDIYAKNVNAKGKEFKKAVEALRTPTLDPIVDVLVAIGKPDKKLLTKPYLTKPSAQELKYWYVLDAISSNHHSEDSKKTSTEVAQEVLAQEIHPYWLVHNYYGQLHVGIAMLSNDKNLSNFNIQLDQYGLANDTEKAALYFAVTNALTQRFRVLQMMKNPERLLEFAQKMPQFNGKPYYEYTAFGFEDFEWNGYGETDSYKKQHLSNLYQVLNAHLEALAETDQIDELKHLYDTSIFSKTDYFPYAGPMQESLQGLYDQINP